MPCFQSITWHDVMFNDRAMLESAVKALGWTIQGNTITTDTGYRMTIQDNKLGGAGVTTDLVNRLKVGYSKEAVKAAATKFGWSRVQAGKKTILSRGI